MKKNIYEKPGMTVVRLQNQNVLCTSNFNPNLQGGTVTGGWSREYNTLGILDPEW